MHLLVSSISTDIPKWQIEEIVERYENVHHMMWISAENGRRKKDSNDFMMVGSIHSLFTYEEENVLMVKIDGLDHARNILKDIRIMADNMEHTHQFIIPILI